MKTVYLVRHAEAGDDRINEVNYNPKNEYDKPLTRLGISQAKKLSKIFHDIKFDRSFVSDYLRAIETYDQLNINCTIHRVLPEIREIFCELIGKNLGNRDLVELEKQKVRVKGFINSYILNMKENENILIVAHGCLNLYLLNILTGKSFGHEMTHTGVTKLVCDEDWDFVYFNNSSHLYEEIDLDIRH